jgi:hypothetical protein
MKALRRILVAVTAVLAAAGAPAPAQETTSPAQSDLIGSPQLRDFSINGTVTRAAPEPVQVQPAQRPAANPAGEQNPQAAPTRPTQPARESSASPARQEPERRDAASVSPELSSPTPAPRIASSTVSPRSDISAMSPDPSAVSAAVNPDLSPSGNDFPIFPWLIAALAFAGAAAWYFLRQRPRESFAGAGRVSAFDAGTPSPQPVRTPPPAPPVRSPPPAAPRQSSGGIVSTRLRPWLEIQFVPQRAVVDEQKAAIAFEVTVFNSGSVPARDVLLEAALFNAGPMQDQQIRMFFENPVAKGDRIPSIPPLKKVAVNTAVFLPREQVRAIEVEGRQLFVPMIAFNALYGWGGGEGQSSASYLVGKTTGGEKLAPFRLDLGPRVFRNLDAREHELRLRK